MLQDLIQADSDRVELQLSRDNLNTYEMFTDIQRKTIDTQNMRYHNIHALLVEVQDQRDSLDLALCELKQRHHKTIKAKRTWAGAAIAAITAFIIK